MTGAIPLDLTDLRPGTIWRLMGRIVKVKRLELVDDGGSGDDAYFLRGAELTAEVQFRRAPDTATPAVDLGDSYAVANVIKISGGQAWMVVSTDFDVHQGLRVSLVRVIGQDDEPAGIAGSEATAP